MGIKKLFNRGWYQLKYCLKNTPLLKTGRILEQKLRAYRKRSKSQGISKSPPIESSLDSGHAPVLSNPKENLEAWAKLALSAHFSSEANLVFPRYETPQVSILLLLYNRAELTYLCLQSLLANVQVPYEVILVDNASSDQTELLLDRIQNVKIVRNEKNVGYVEGCNIAAEQAIGEYLLLLNNDTQITSAAIPTALGIMDADPTVGGVGGRLILPDGSLQEAGSLIWAEGNTLGYGRGQHIESYEFMFQRTVDYCSAAFLLVRRSEFESVEGFDLRYAPAYHEEVDFCTRLAQKGLRIVYDPRIVILHYEFASSGSQERAMILQKQHRQLYQELHHNWLSHKHHSAVENILQARTPASPAQRLLFIDDRIPHPELGSGFPRANRMLQILADMGYEVTLFPIHNYQETWKEAYRDLPRTIEIVQGAQAPTLMEFLIERKNYYASILISRPHNMKKLQEILCQHPDILGNARLIYDAEAIFSLREINQLKLNGVSLSQEKQEQMISEEIDLICSAEVVLAVSAGEADFFREQGKKVFAIGHAVEVAEQQNWFEQRAGLLFVGAVHDPKSPNARSLEWLCQEILPKLRQKSSPPVEVTIAGTMLVSTQQFCRSHGCHVLGRVEDLSQVYNEARVFIAPTQFAAGIPLKIIEAAAQGVPVVATRLLANQLGWTHEKELLVADTAEDFAAACLRLHQEADLWYSLRDHARAAVLKSYSAEGIADTFREFLPAFASKYPSKL